MKVAWLGQTRIDFTMDPSSLSLADEWFAPLAEPCAEAAGDPIRIHVERGEPRASLPKAGVDIDIDGIPGRVDRHALVLRDGEHAMRIPHASASLTYRYEVAPSRDAFLFGWAIAALARGWHHVHAAALRLRDGRRALLVGSTRAGKTTTALTLALHGATWGSDDCIFIHDSGQIAPIPRAFYVRERTFHSLPQLQEHAVAELRRDEVRHRVDVGELTGRAPERLWDAVDVAIFPSVTMEPTTELRPMDMAEGLGLLIESSPYVGFERLPGASEGLSLLAQTLSGSSCWALRLGLDALNDSALVSRLLERDAH